MSQLWPWSPEPPSNYEKFKRALGIKTKPKEGLLAQLRTSLVSIYSSLDYRHVGFGCLALAGAGEWIYWSFFRRIRNVNYITPAMIKRRQWIKGVVTRVGDSDNLRLFHTPGPGWHWLRTIPTARSDLTGETIPIRLAGIDAPEGDHFGACAQPFYQKSLTWLTDMVMGKTVYCQILHKDQYDRIVAAVHLNPIRQYLPWLPSFLFMNSNVSMAMLIAGWAEVYTQKNAMYGDSSRTIFEILQEYAQQARLGIWQNGLVRESSAEHKRKLREANKQKRTDPSSDSSESKP